MLWLGRGGEFSLGRGKVEWRKVRLSHHLRILFISFYSLSFSLIQG